MAKMRYGGKSEFYYHFGGKNCDTGGIVKVVKCKEHTITHYAICESPPVLQRTKDTEQM